MKNNTIEHTIFQEEKWRKIVLWKLRKKGFRKQFYRSAFFFDQILKSSPIPKKGLEDIVKTPKVSLENFVSRNGNVSPYELLVLCSVVSFRRALNILEIGTFDGNTTLQLALNAPENAIIHTIDLPPNSEMTTLPVLESDLMFIRDEKKHWRKYEGINNVKQHFGDSTSYDFSQFGNPDFVFIDGGHSYQCVKSDTENVLKILAPNGVIFWHDFTPLFGGVFKFLSELSSDLPLTHIEGTNLVYYTKEK